MNKPFFSVVMPTRNRANLLPFAVQSVLNQTFDDFEIIISDNFSSDETSAVAQRFDDTRIKYFRSEEPLSIGNSFHFALSHAKGEYIAFLSDDDAFTPIMLERVKGVIDKQKAQLVAIPWGRYYLTDNFDLNRKIAPNTLAIPQFTRKVTKFDADQAIKLIYRNARLNNFDRNNHFVMPYIVNVVYHHSVFSRLEAIRAKYFDFTPCDMYVAAAMFFVTDHYYCLDEPLYIWSRSTDNATASPYKKGDKFIEHYKKLLKNGELVNTPLKCALPYNCYVNAILQAKYDFEIQGDETKVDWGSYYFAVYEDLMSLKGMKIDISQEISEFNSVLSQESPQVKSQVESKIKSVSFTAKQFLRKFPHAFRLAKSTFKDTKSEEPIIFDGSTQGFCNALKCSEMIDEEFLNKYLSN